MCLDLIVQWYQCLASLPVQNPKTGLNQKAYMRHMCSPCCMVSENRMNMPCSYTPYNSRVANKCCRYVICTVGGRSVDERACRAVGARPLRSAGLLLHELLQCAVCFSSTFFQAPALSADFFLQRAELICVVLVECECAAPEAAVYVRRFVAIDDLRLAC